MSTSAPKSRASVCAVSVSSVELIVIIMRRSRIFFIRSLTFTSSLSARSFTVMPSASVMSLVIGGGASSITGATGRSSRRPPVRGRGPAGLKWKFPGRLGNPVAGLGAPGACGRTG
jgi:hypothetical protein